MEEPTPAQQANHKPVAMNGLGALVHRLRSCLTMPSGQGDCGPASVGSTAPRSGWLNAGVVIAVSVTSAILSAIILRHGVICGPDQWASWEGAVSLIEHGRYTYVDGEPILSWPPLFSMFLGVMQLVFPQTGRTLALAMTLVSGFTAATWSCYVLRVFGTLERDKRLPALAGALLFVTLFVPLCCVTPLAHCLWLGVMGLWFCQMLSLGDRPMAWLGWRQPSGAAVLLAIASMIHNTTIIYAGVAALLVVGRLVLMEGRLRLGNVLPGAIICAGMIPWIVLRYALGQTGSHALSASAYTPVETVWQLFCGIGSNLISTSSLPVQFAVGCLVVAGLLAIAVRRPRAVEAARGVVSGRVVVLSLAALFVLFNLTRLEAPLSGRFLWYVPLAAMPVFFAQCGHRLAWVAALMVFTVGVSGWRVSKFLRAGALPPFSGHPTEAPAVYVPAEYFLTTRPDAPLPPGTVRVEPPTYPWMQRWSETSLPEATKRSVKIHSLPRDPSR